MFAASPAEERYLLLPGLSLILGADPGSREKVLLQIKHQPARWIQHVQTAAPGGQRTLTHTHTHMCSSDMQMRIWDKQAVVICIILACSWGAK